MFQQAPMSPIFDVRCVHRPNSTPIIRLRHCTWVLSNFSMFLSLMFAQTGMACSKCGLIRLLKRSMPSIKTPAYCCICRRTPADYENLWEGVFCGTRNAECGKLWTGNLRKMQCGFFSAEWTYAECHRNEHLLNTGTRHKLETHKSMPHLRDV